MRTQVNPAQYGFVPGTSKSPRNVHTLHAQMELAQRLGFAKRLRELRGITPQMEVSRAADVGYRSYQGWEEAKTGISWPNLEKLAAFFGVTTNWLLYGDEKPEGARSQLDRLELKLDHIVDLIAGLEPAEEAPPKRKRRTGGA